MLGLGLRSSQSAGSSAAPPAPSFATLLSSDFNIALSSSQKTQGANPIGGDVLTINPYTTGGSVRKAVLPANWAQGYEAVTGTANTLVANDITSVGVWDTKVVDGVTENIYPLSWTNGLGSTSSAGTGPQGPPTSRTDSTVDTTASDNGRYIYSESSSAQSGYSNSNSSRVFLVRTPGINFSSVMSSTSNVVRVEMQAHGFGQRIGKLQVWMDDASTSNTTTAVKVFEHDGFDQPLISSPYNILNFEVDTIDLPGSGSIDVRTTDSSFYFYIVHEPGSEGSAFTADLAIDNFFIEEVS